MTCCVALEHNDKVYLGSDSFMGNSNSRDQMDRPKFFQKGEKLHIAFAGDIRGAQVVEHDIKFRAMKADETEEAYLVVEVARKLQAKFNKEGLVKTVESETTNGTDFLACINNKVFLIQNDFSVVRSRHGFAGIGNGSDYALGAMAAMKTSKLDPRKKVFRALEIAAKLGPQVCAPFHVIEV